MRWSPFLSTATVDEKVDETLTAMISFEETTLRLMSFLDAFINACHQSSGSCSAPPPGKNWIGVDSKSKALTCPLRLMIAA